MYSKQGFIQRVGALGLGGLGLGTQQWKGRSLIDTVIVNITKNSVSILYVYSAFPVLYANVLYHQNA